MSEKEPEYHYDGRCDYIYTWDCTRCPKKAEWLHIKTGLAYCKIHSDCHEGKVEAGWKPI